MRNAPFKHAEGPVTPDPVRQEGTEAECDRLLLPARIIVNADDWGLRSSVTDRILDCVQCGAVSAASAMVWMEDSERAADLAQEHHVDTGLHLNFTGALTGRGVPTRLEAHHAKLMRFLQTHRLAPVLSVPFLADSFEYVTKAQIEEYQRLYGSEPKRYDGHHHRHLAANVFKQRLIPAGAVMRRNQTFAPHEKGVFNRWYRDRQDRRLASRYRITDYLFDLVPMEDLDRIRRILELSRHADVELEVHPAVQQQYEFLKSGRLQRCAENVVIARGFQLRERDNNVLPKVRETDAHRGTGRTAIDISPSVPSADKAPHICVCICTYRRPGPLRRLLEKLATQKTDGLFTFSIVVADNDAMGSARDTVNEIRRTLALPVTYCVEPQRGIARARNKAVSHAEGDYLAWIDDDEFPIPDWLKTLYLTCVRYGVDGVLGPVKRHFEQEPPHWLKASNLYDRRTNPTGMPIEWRESRTGNVLMKRALVAGDPAPFRPELRSGEDQDFFRGQMERGRRFVWCSAAIVYEVIPPARWKRMYYVRKALLQGATAALRPDCGPRMIAKALVAVPLYTLALPFACMAGQHRFMELLVKLCDHAGKILQWMHINPIREEYVSD